LTLPVRVIAVIGPTASGKTAVGIQLAQRIGAEIISVDSMQVYRWMDIGTAKPSLEMRAAVPHHLIDILDPDEAYNAGKFADDADTIIQQLAQQEKPAILLGGTNLYLKALIHGIIPTPTVSTSIKTTIQALYDSGGVEACYEELKQVDPKSAVKLHPNDISRITRALGVMMETGISIQDLQDQHRFLEDKYQVLMIGLKWDRTKLYERINQRVMHMVDEGLIQEAEGLQERGYDSELPSMKSIGYKQTFQYLNGKIGRDEMIADIQQKSRHYAKKQLTWYRNDPNVMWLQEDKLNEATFATVDSFLA
jgi:tRNA dimethylallyltransferase